MPLRTWNVVQRALPGVLMAGAMLTSGDSVASEMRDPAFRGVKRIAILAQYGPASDVVGGVESSQLCAEVRELASRGAPLPVTCGNIGDAVLDQSGTMVLVAQASVSPGVVRGSKIFAVTMRALWSGGLEPAPIYFGAAPRLAPYSDTPAGRAARMRALDAALSEVLPWRIRAGRGGRLD